MQNRDRHYAIRFSDDRTSLQKRNCHNEKGLIN